MELLATNRCTNGICAIIFGSKTAGAMPVTMPQKYPQPLKRHQYHFITLAAMYPPHSPETIQITTEFTESTFQPIKTPTTTTAKDAR